MSFDPCALTAPTGVHTLEMPFEWDETKREVNIRKHGVDFVLVEGFDMETAMQVPDLRYDEPRVRAYGYIGNRMHVLVYVRREANIRIISLRKANRREEVRYAAS